ncbi:RING finger protein 112-like [Mauremys reevesii]|uniref:RING finger protein 112-like n=1 Tax=Mauremys reevesii TaxID=260615 RepID=UPI0019401625|nr:RING finger protein 112-like [Mauremys reevesii]
MSWTTPVSIERGHNFFQGCLAAHWRGVSAWSYQCPECWTPCYRDRMIPDTQLRALVEKITEPLREEMELQGPGAQPEPGRPVQLVHLDEEGGPTLDEEALSRCLEQDGAAEDASWMGREDQALAGFESRAGMVTVTRGVWMWDQPLWVEDQGRKIFNISSTFKRTEVDYLEVGGAEDRHSSTDTDLAAMSLLGITQIFVHVAKEVGETCDLPPIQHLDLLVRDWQLSGAYGVDGGQAYLRDIRREMIRAGRHELEASAEQPLVLGALRTSSTRCYLLPHPGSRFIKSRAGTPGDMDTIFQQYLCGYVSTMVGSAGTHVRMDRARQVLTGAQLAARIKGVYQYLKTRRYDFSSPMKMAETFAAMRQETNSKTIEDTRKEYEQFVQDQDRGHQSMIPCLRVKPEEMEQRLQGKCKELLERCRGKLLGEDPKKWDALKKLEQELDKKTAQFLTAYEQRFKEKKAVRLGLACGGGILAAVGVGIGAGIGIGVAAVIVAVGEAVAIGVGAGGLGLIGGAVGSWVGALIGQKTARNTTRTNAPGQGDEAESRAGHSDQEPLLGGDR